VFIEGLERKFQDGGGWAEIEDQVKFQQPGMQEESF
jgi:hypothetical protein